MYVKRWADMKRISFSRSTVKRTTTPAAVLHVPQPKQRWCNTRCVWKCPYSTFNDFGPLCPYAPKCASDKCALNGRHLVRSANIGTGLNDIISPLLYLRLLRVCPTLFLKSHSLFVSLRITPSFCLSINHQIKAYPEERRPGSALPLLCVMRELFKKSILLDIVLSMSCTITAHTHTRTHDKCAYMCVSECVILRLAKLPKLHPPPWLFVIRVNPKKCEKNDFSSPTHLNQSVT